MVSENEATVDVLLILEQFLLSFWAKSKTYNYYLGERERRYYKKDFFTLFQ